MLKNCIICIHAKNTHDWSVLLTEVCHVFPAGNIVSFLVFLAPIPTFLRVYRKKSTEGFSSVPYVVALFSCALWIFYSLIKTNCGPVITINAFGCVVESAYIIVYLIYAPRAARVG